MGLDLASRAGFCVWTDDAAGPVVSCGSWDCTKADDFDGKAEVLSDHLTGLIRDMKAEGRPIRRAAVEAPIRRLPTRRRMNADGVMVDEMASNPNTMVILPSLIGAACAILRQFRIPKDMVAPASWRKLVLGTGRAPKGKDSRWFKSEMRMRAELLGERYDFRIPNHDASDAVGIAIWAVAQSGHLPAGLLTGRGPTLFAREAAE